MEKMFLIFTSILIPIQNNIYNQFLSLSKKPMSQKKTGISHFRQIVNTMFLQRHKLDTTRVLFERTIEKITEIITHKTTQADRFQETHK